MVHWRTPGLVSRVRLVMWRLIAKLNVMEATRVDESSSRPQLGFIRSARVQTNSASSLAFSIQASDHVACLAASGIRVLLLGPLLVSSAASSVLRVWWTRFWHLRIALALWKRLLHCLTRGNPTSFRSFYFRSKVLCFRKTVSCFQNDSNSSILIMARIGMWEVLWDMRTLVRRDT